MDINQQKPTPTKSPENKDATPSASINKGSIVTIKDTPQGWLRVREDALISASESAKVKSGEKYDLLDEKDGWYKIKFNGNVNGLESGQFTEGWISSQYSVKE